MSADPRPRAQRRLDTEHRLAHDVDVWVATASAEVCRTWCRCRSTGTARPCCWPRRRTAPPAGTWPATRAVRLALGHTRDVTMIEGDVEVLEIDALPRELGDRFAARTGFDPRADDTPYRWFRITPRRIQAWREANELA